MLRITKMTDYAVVLLAHMATSGDHGVWNAKDLAEVSHLPAPMVSKILKRLARGQLLRSHRGIHGGYHLSKAPKDMSLMEIVSVLEGPLAITECVEGSHCGCGLETICPTTEVWKTVNQTVAAALSTVSLEDAAKPLSARRPGVPQASTASL